jgi:hypothetical protein
MEYFDINASRSLSTMLTTVDGDSAGVGVFIQFRNPGILPPVSRSSRFMISEWIKGR